MPWNTTRSHRSRLPTATLLFQPYCIVAIRHVAASKLYYWRFIPELVELLEQRDDLKAIERAMQNTERIPWEQVKTELGVSG